jgi:hypothetical protein
MMYFFFLSKRPSLSGRPSEKVNVGLSGECTVRKYLERSICDLVEVLSRRLAADTEEIH